MNRTQRAILKSCKQGADSYRRQKNEDIEHRNRLIAKRKGTTGEARRELNRDIRHMSECITKDRALVRYMDKDRVIYKNRFAETKDREDKAV